MSAGPRTSTVGAHRRGGAARARRALAAMARSTPGRLCLLAAMVVAVWLVSAAIAALTDASSSYGTALWSGLRHLFDPGSLGDDDTTAQRLVGVAQVFTGLIFLAGVAFTVLSDGVERGLRRLSEAQPPVATSDHLLVIGSGNVLSALLAALAAEPGGPPVRTVVTLNAAPGEALPSGDQPYRLVARTGDARDPTELAGAAAADARAIAVIGDGSTDPEVADLGAFEIAAALAEHLDGAPGAAPPVAVHVQRIANVVAAWELLPDAFDAVPGDRNVGAVLALAATMPRHAGVLAASPVGDSRLHVTAAGELGGAPFGAALARCPRAVPVGLLRDGRIEYAPPADETIAHGDGLIVHAADPAGARARRPAASVPAPASSPAMTLEATVPGPIRVLVLGWSPDGDDMLHQLPSSVELTVVARLDGPPLASPAIRLRDGDPLDGDVIAAAIAEERPAIVIVLGGCNGASSRRGAHARAALAALKVSRSSAQSDLTIVVEQDGIESAQRLRSADPRIRVVSRAELVAQALLLSSTDRPGLAAREALAVDEGTALQEIRASGDEPVPFAEVYRRLLDRRAVPIAVLRDGDEIDILDPAAAVVRPTDVLLVLRRTDAQRG